MFTFVASGAFENCNKDRHQFVRLVRQGLQTATRYDAFFDHQLQPIKGFIRFLQAVTHLGNKLGF